MRNLLEEFNEDHGVRAPTILGVREHIFTGRSYSHFIEFSVNSYSVQGLALPDCHLILTAVFLLWLGLCQIKKQAL